MPVVDVHTHLLPPELPRWKERFGYGGFIRLEHTGPCRARMLKDDGRGFREVEENLWAPAARLADCERFGVDVQVLSTVPVMFSYWAKPEDVPIRQGELFLLPAGVPHSPLRPAGTVGLVVECPKFARGTHHLRWYCRSCGSVLHDAAFEPVDLGKQIKAMIGEFSASQDLRTCKKCGAVFSV